MATVYLSLSSAGEETLRRHSDEGPLDLLVAYPLLDYFNRIRPYISVRKWMLDSGAFSVYNSGGFIDIKEYIKVCKDVDACEVIALDDMDSWQKSMQNTSQMWTSGVRNAMPVFHVGEPWEYLAWCVKHADKIGLSGKIKTRPKWLGQCFARFWKKNPKKVHGFGMAGWRALQTAPFDSVDASSWATAPGRFGQYAGYTGRQIHLKSRMKGSSSKDLWVEVVEHQKRAKWSEDRWAGELAKLKDRSEEKFK